MDMNSVRRMNTKTCTIAAPPARAGTSTLDALVAFTLLVTTLSVATPLVVRHGRLLKSQRDYRLALDELSNQMERVIATSASDVPAAIQQIAPSEFLIERIPSAQISGELQAVDGGMRVVLQLTWNELAGRRTPVSLAAWIFLPSQPKAGVDSVEGGQP
jgi:hypothetical protein